jgi:hypothetical protein
LKNPGKIFDFEPLKGTDRMVVIGFFNPLNMSIQPFYFIKKSTGSRITRIVAYRFLLRWFSKESERNWINNFKIK